MAKFINVGSPTIATSIFGKIFITEFNPLGPELSSSADATMTRL